MSRGIITMKSLGRLGRFANQLIQYTFIKTYARDHDLDVQLPPWIGNELFGCDDPPITVDLPPLVERHDDDPRQAPIPQLRRPLCNVDVSGFFQYATWLYAPHKDYIRSLLTPSPPIARLMNRGWSRLRSLGDTIVGAHLRRGDYGYSYFYITPTSWYVQWLDTIWDSLERPVLFVASDEPHKALPELARFRPVTCADLGIRLPSAPFYPDFHMLSRADILAIPNSTFSVMAAMLNARLRLAVRSCLREPLPQPPFRAFDPWDDVFLDRRSTVEQFPCISGIAAPRRGEGNWKRWWELLRGKSSRDVMRAAN